MSCIKTGARIYFENYGYEVRGDIYSIGDCFVIRWNVESRLWQNLLSVVDATPSKGVYLVSYIIDSDAWWHRDDLGITVIPARMVQVL